MIDERREQRPEREPDVAADREERHPARAAAAADVARELRSLRVVGGDAEARDDDGEHDERVRRARSPRPPSRRPRSPRRPAGARARRARPTRAPNSGWMIEEANVPASTSAAAIVYERPNSSTRNGSSAGSEPCARSVTRCPDESTPIALRSTSLTPREDSIRFRDSSGTVRHRHARLRALRSKQGGEGRRPRGETPRARAARHAGEDSRPVPSRLGRPDRAPADRAGSRCRREQARKRRSPPNRGLPPGEDSPAGDMGGRRG